MRLRDQLLAALHPPARSGVVDERVEGTKSIRVVLRPDGDVQIEFHLPGRAGSPFEQLFVLPPDEKEAAVDEICQFVDGLLNEKIVLAVDGRLVRGGRRWVSPEELNRVAKLRFSASWHGTFDR